ncbi:MAG: Fe2+ transport system protein FeoA, partial [Paracoccaceae bacterium]
STVSGARFDWYRTIFRLASAIGHAHRSDSPKNGLQMRDRIALHGALHQLFCNQFIHRGEIEHLLGQQLLQPPVLVITRLKSLGLRHCHAAKLGLPGVKSAF